MATTRRRKWAIAAAAILAAIIAWQPKTRGHGPVSPFRQITFDEDAAYPALSRDGKRLAYSVAGVHAGQHSLWVKDVESTSPPRRLTDGLWNDYDANLSPDGAYVYFTSDRQPPGMYRVPSNGGAVELVRAQALTPRFSPDGRWLLFNANAALTVTPVEGGSSRTVSGSQTNCYAPVWSPDSRSILFACGVRRERPEWWISSGNSVEPQRTGLATAFARSGFSYIELQAWLPGNEMVFAGRKGETMTLWRIGFDPATRSVTHDPVPATDATGDTGASFAAGRLAFARTTVGLNLWSLPLDGAGRVPGPPVRLTSTPNQKGSASISRDGRTLLYSAERDGVYSLLLRDIPSGKEREIVSGPFLATLRPDGGKFAYAQGPMDHLDVRSDGAAWWWRWWFSHPVCSACGVPRGYTPDGASVLLWANAETDDHVDLADVSSGRVTRVLSAKRFYSPQLSPDGHSIVFGVRAGEHEFESWIAPIHSGRPTTEFEWVPLMRRSETYHIPFWSADGSQVYILSNHGGGNLKWLESQPIDSRTRSLVYQFQEPRVPTMDPLWNSVMSVPGGILIELGDIATNIWLGPVNP